MNKIIHIRGKTKPRLCGAKGDFEPVGTETDIPVCGKCACIHLAETGELIE